MTGHEAILQRVLSLPAQLWLASPPIGMNDQQGAMGIVCTGFEANCDGLNQPIHQRDRVLAGPSEEGHFAAAVAAHTHIVKRSADEDPTASFIVWIALRHERVTAYFV